MKHPKFRVKSVVDFDKSVLDELENLFDEVIKLLPVKPKDVEIVGSYANGCADLHSDIDVAMPCKDWNDQILLRRALYGADIRLLVSVNVLLQTFFETYDIKIDFNPVIPDNKDNKNYATYSLKERKLYNSPADLVHFYLSLSPYTQRYILKQYTNGDVPVISKLDLRKYAEPVKYASDKFASEVSEWKVKYKDKFIEYKILPTGELSE